MVAKFFGEFLLAKDLITQQQLEQVLEVQKQSNKMLGELAISTGMLNKDSASEINLKQQVENKYFGEIAIEMGFLEESQIEKLLLIQKKQRKFFGEILVELEFLSAQELQLELHAHDQQQQQAYQSMLQSVAQDPLTDYLVAAIETTNRMFLRILHERSKFARLIESVPSDSNYQVVSQIPLSKEQGLSLTLASNEKTAAQIASRFTSQSIDDCDLAFNIDATGEFLNILIGQLMSEVDDINPNSPRVPSNDISPESLFETAQNLLSVEMDSQIGNFLLIISQN